MPLGGRRVHGRTTLDDYYDSVVFWLLGFLLHFGGGLIHLILLVVVILIVVNLITGRGARV